MFTDEEKWAIALSTFAGLSTTIGGLLAVSSFVEIAIFLLSDRNRVRIYLIAFSNCLFCRRCLRRLFDVLMMDSSLSSSAQL